MKQGRIVCLIALLCLCASVAAYAQQGPSEEAVETRREVRRQARLAKMSPEDRERAEARRLERIEFRKQIENMTGEEKRNYGMALKAERAQKRAEQRARIANANEVFLSSQISRKSKLKKNEQKNLVALFLKQKQVKGDLSDPSNQELIEIFQSVANNPEMTFEQKKIMIKKKLSEE